MDKLNYKQKIAHKYYLAYSALCCYHHDGIKDREQSELRTLREIMHLKYKQYDPDNTFDVRKNYSI